MKIRFLVSTIFILFSIISCIKKSETSQIYSDLSDDIVYTDSFIPNAWEEPLKRRRINPIDKDIGNFIYKDTTEPFLREIYYTINTFFISFKNKNFGELENILTTSALNSFKIRASEVELNENYILRIAYPEFFSKHIDATADQNQILIIPDKFWIDFKLLFSNYSIKSSLELRKIGEKFFISDFDTQFFVELKKLKETPRKK